MIKIKKKMLIGAAFISAVFVLTVIKAYNHLLWEKTFLQSMSVTISDLQQESSEKDKKIESLKEQLAVMRSSLEEIHIVCWGDSLTAGAGGDAGGYPTVIQELAINDGYQVKVVNMGVGGEGTKTILARGALDMVLEECRIPSETVPVEIHFRLLNGETIAPLRQGGAGITHGFVNGISGTISIEQESSTSTEYKYFFTRSEPGEACQVEKGTYLINEGSYLYQDHIPVIFIGQNGGWESPEDLIAQQQLLLNTLDDSNKYIILGLTSGSEADRKDLEEAMVSQWGKHYINLRKYLSENGLEDAGMMPSGMDEEQMERGIVPDSLRVDGVHFNKEGYRLIGEVVYKRMRELHYIE